jgi:hypothetical protein
MENLVSAKLKPEIITGWMASGLLPLSDEPPAGVAFLSLPLGSFEKPVGGWGRTSHLSATVPSLVNDFLLPAAGTVSYTCCDQVPL